MHDLIVASFASMATLFSALALGQPLAFLITQIGTLGGRTVGSAMNDVGDGTGYSKRRW